MKFLLIAAAVLMQTQALMAAPACDGGECSGGGNRLGNEFFDSYLGRREIDPEKEKVFKDIESILQKVEEQVPQLAVDLRKSLKKDWYLIDRKFQNLVQKK